jgi:UDP-3-O-[3-hydroxymyristoyl] N-acetylglucosamine deacetylase
VVFARTDLPVPAEVPAVHSAVTSTRLATTLGRGEATIGTVEHLLAALCGLGIDNVRAEVDGPEIPVMDGSAASFVFLIRAAGIFEQDAPRRSLRVRKPVEVRDGDRLIRIEPARGLRVTYSVDFAHPAIGRQQLRNLVIDDESFEQEICRARTFGFLREVEALWRNGLARGGNLDNTVVMDELRVLNRDGLRWPDEFVRHKALDLLGDLALLGMPVEGHLVVERGGHALHQRFVRALLEHPSHWTIETETRPSRRAGSVRGAALARASV